MGPYSKIKLRTFNDQVEPLLHTAGEAFIVYLACEDIFSHIRDFNPLTLHRTRSYERFHFATVFIFLKFWGGTIKSTNAQYENPCQRPTASFLNL